VQINGPRAAVILTRSTITANGTGLDQEGGSANTFFSFSDNTILLNGTDGVTPVTGPYK
jgi:hypothetical protein